LGLWTRRSLDYLNIGDSRGRTFAPRGPSPPDRPSPTSNHPEFFRAKAFPDRLRIFPFHTAQPPNQQLSAISFPRFRVRPRTMQTSTNLQPKPWENAGD